MPGHVLETDGAKHLVHPAAGDAVTLGQAEQEADPRCLHAVFRRQDLTPGAVAAIEEAQRRARAKGSRDEAVPVGRALFLRTPDGLGRSELAAQLARSGVQADGTARNWATVTRLMARLDTGA